MNLSVANLRQNYTRAGLTEGDALSDPLEQFKIWFAEAVEAQLLEPNAMTLATVGPGGQPSARIVLLKGFDERGFVFYTNYQSSKGKQLEEKPKAAIAFWWGELERQVRIEGTIEKVAPEESDQYFQSRPLNSQLGAWVSNQSQVIPSREVLEKRFEQLRLEYEGKTIPRPPYWGGYRVMPKQFEFWQGRPSRLHDRLLYRLLEDGSWRIERLSP
ncbi:MAG: pyridoxamine 5'-phosphate oxidase [Prochloron sp. SP5CPC1]|nr:pyridoxamine 5'-phosphate oxidase [Candidatus Paraprochloron terpiosi SP5CPC1]